MKPGSRHSADAKARIAGATATAMREPEIAQRQKAAREEPAAIARQRAAVTATTRTPEFRRAQSERMRTPEMSKRRRDGENAAQLARLHAAWRKARPEMRGRFLSEIAADESGLQGAVQ